MKTCIFLCKKRHSLFNLERIYDPSKYRFVCILTSEDLKNIPDEHKNFFDEIITINSIVESEIEPIVQKEINLAGSSENVRVLCLDEMDILTAASIRKRFHIPGGRVSDYLPFRNKILMKEMLLKNNIRVPAYVSLNDLDSNESEVVYENIVTQIGSPFIVKPILGASSLHTAKIENYKQFLTWNDSVNKVTHPFEAEEYIEGKFYHCDSFVKAGEIVFAEVCEYLTTCLDYANGNTSLGSIVLPNRDKIRNAIIEFNKKVIDILNPPDCALHHELFVTHEGEIIFLEIAARPPGAIAVSILEKNFGINLYEISLRNELGEDLCFQSKNNPYHGWLYVVLPQGKIKSIRQPELKSHFHIEWKVSVGDIIPPPNNSLLRHEAAKITFHHPDFDVLNADFNYLRNYQGVEVE